MTEPLSTRLDRLAQHLSARPVGEPIDTTRRAVADLARPARDLEITLNKVKRILHDNDDHDTIVEALLELLPPPPLENRIRAFGDGMSMEAAHTLDGFADEVETLASNLHHAQRQRSALQITLAAVEGERDRLRRELDNRVAAARHAEDRCPDRHAHIPEDG